MTMSVWIGYHKAKGRCCNAADRMGDTVPMTKQELKEILAEQFSCDENELTSETTLAELGADHEDLIELAWQLGEAIGVEVDEDRLQEVETLDELWRLARELEEEAE